MFCFYKEVFCLMNIALMEHAQIRPISKSTQSNSITAYRLRVRVRGNSDREKQIKRKNIKNV